MHARSPWPAFARSVAASNSSDSTTASGSGVDASSLNDVASWAASVRRCMCTSSCARSTSSSTSNGGSNRSFSFATCAAKSAAIASAWRAASGPVEAVASCSIPEARLRCSAIMSVTVAASSARVAATR